MAIEQTGKIWKLLILFGSLGLLIGVVWIIGLVVTSQTDGYVAPGVIAFGGLCSRLTGSMGKWWFHE